MKHPALVYVIAILSGLGGFLFGYDTGVISGAILFIKTDFALGTFQQEIVVATLLLFAAIGALIGGRLSDKFGRKRVIMLAAFCFIAGAILMALAPGFGTLVGGRAVVGLAIGVASMTVPLYVSELSPPSIRGLCVSINQLMVTIGIVVAYAVDLSFAPTESWRWMLGLSMVPAIILFLAMFFLPETPRWLLAQGREDEARPIFKKIGTTDAETEKMIESEQENLSEEKPGIREMFTRSIRIPLIIGMLLALCQQITGINTIIYYAPTIFELAGFEGPVSALIATSVVGIMNVLVTIIAIFIIDRVGRRPLLLWGTAAMAVGLIALGFIWLVPHNTFTEAAAVASLLLYIAGFAIGLGPIAWLILAEIYPQRVRGTAMSWGTFINWISNFAVALTFLTILNAIGPTLTFWLYGVLSIGTIIYFYFFLPETKGKTLEEIEHAWKHADI